MNSSLEKDSEAVAGILKLLAHPKRLRILCALSSGKKHVGNLEKLCDISQSQLSQFLGKLEKEGILASEKQGQFVEYWIADNRIVGLLQYLEANFCSCSL